MAEKKWPVGRYAPGNYSCKCVGCEQTFIGDKRATECHECVIQAQQEEIKKLRSALSAISEAPAQIYAEQERKSRTEWTR